MNIRTSMFLFAAVVAFCPACLSLKEVNEYAATSVVSLNRINELNYSYSEYCRRDCEFRQMQKGEIDTFYNCVCTPIAAKADSTILLIHQTLLRYLQAVEKISNNQNFRYDVSGFAGAIQQNSLLRLSEQQTSVITKAGNILATAATSFYRKKELKKYLEKADPVFSDLVDIFLFLLNDRLRKQLRNDYEIRFANETQMLGNAKNDKGFKQFIVKQSLDERAWYTSHVAYLNCYVALLRKVQEGHHQLYLQRDHLKDSNVKELAKRYAADLQDIAATVKQ